MKLIAIIILIFAVIIKALTRAFIFTLALAFVIPLGRVDTGLTISLAALLVAWVAEVFRQGKG